MPRKYYSKQDNLINSVINKLVTAMEKWGLRAPPPVRKTKDYIVERDGRIWSRKTNEIVKGSVQSKGYIQLADKTLVHRLVAELWVPGQTDLKNQVNHIDGNKLNNAASNL